MGFYLLVKGEKGFLGSLVFFISKPDVINTRAYFSMLSLPVFLISQL